MIINVNGLLLSNMCGFYRVQINYCNAYIDNASICCYAFIAASGAYESKLHVRICSRALFVV